MKLKLKGVYRGKDALWRLIHVDDKLCYLYPLGQGGGKYSTVPIGDFNSELESGSIMEAEDPYSKRMSAPLKESVALRAEKRMKLIEGLVSNPEVLYNIHERNAAIKEISKNHGVTVRHLYTLLSAWWERGQCPSALGPGYKNSKPTNPEVAESRGRPSTLTREIRNAFEKAYSKYLLKVNPCSVPEAYRYFRADYLCAHPGDVNLEYPTFWQFLYQFKKSHSGSEVRRRQNKDEVWRKDLRPLEGSANQVAEVPGSRYEIDSTEADVALVGSHDRSEIVGRPTLYVVTDACTGMIVGVLATLDDPQFKGAADAIYNAVRGMEQVCTELGIAVPEGEWPSRGVPSMLVADNAELLGGKIETFTKNYGVKIGFTSPYRADQKGSVESSIGLLQSAIKGLMVGIPEKKASKKAGYKDTRPEAAYTLDEYRRFAVIGAMIANNRIRTKVPSEIGLSAEPTPLGIWKWMETNRHLDLMDPGDLERLRISLLPSVDCTLSRNGIMAEGIRYQCEKARQEGYFDRQTGCARPTGFSLAYDPANVSNAWMVVPVKNKPVEYWNCELACESQYLSGLCWKEAQEALTAMKDLVAKSKASLQEKNTKLTAMAQKLAQEALEKKPKTMEKGSARIKKIKLNRQKERMEDEKAHPRTVAVKKKGPSKAGHMRNRGGVKLSCVGHPQLAKDIPD